MYIIYTFITEDKQIPLHVEHLVLSKSFPTLCFNGVPTSPAIHSGIKFNKFTNLLASQDSIHSINSQSGCKKHYSIFNIWQQSLRFRRNFCQKGGFIFCHSSCKNEMCNISGIFPRHDILDYITFNVNMCFVFVHFSTTTYYSSALALASHQLGNHWSTSVNIKMATAHF